MSEFEGVVSKAAVTEVTGLKNDGTRSAVSY
jgi:hypothetical protein